MGAGSPSTFIRAGPGSQFFVSYALPRIPVSEELSVRSARAIDRVACRSSAGCIARGHRPGDEGAFVLMVPGRFSTRSIAGRESSWSDAAGDRAASSVLRASTRRPVRLDGRTSRRLSSI